MSRVAPAEVHERLGKHLLVDRSCLVYDAERSQGSWVVDERTGARYLDLNTFHASSPLGSNPPGMVDDPEFMDLLGRIAANKPANPDIYSTYLCEFVDTFVRVLGDPDLPHLFFVEGGALAVENALKAAFDWKSRFNEASGRDPALGTRVLHLSSAFHGRSGYTLSLTNTDPAKTDRFPTFDWPRVEVPAIRFPLDRHRDEVLAAERRALDQAREAFDRFPHDIACFIAEPIQGEGGDNHMRPEFLQAMQRMCHDNDALFVLDEVQTGVGLTGTPWAYQQLGLEPDIVVFSKKVQLGGIMAGRRLNRVPGNVFRTRDRINSTWGGGLVDMVRSRRILEIIERDGVFAHAAETGAWLVAQLDALQGRHVHSVSNVRGRGLMTAFDLPDRSSRDLFLSMLRDRGQVLALACGELSVRFRPALTVTREELQHGLDALDRCLKALESG